jgi:hypothetical protein
MCQPERESQREMEKNGGLSLYCWTTRICLEELLREHSNLYRRDFQYGARGRAGDSPERLGFVMCCCCDDLNGDFCEGEIGGLEKSSMRNVRLVNGYWKGW